MPDSFEFDRFLPYLLNQAAEASSLSFQRVYKDRYGMLRTDFRVLFHLGLYGQMTAREIGLRARIHKTKISRAVQRLHDKRYLKRERDEQDGRVEHLSLTKAGQSVYSDLREIGAQHDARLLQGLSDTEAETLRRLLRHVADQHVVGKG